MSRVVEAFTQLERDGTPAGQVRLRPVGDGVRVGITPDGTRVLVVEVGPAADTADDRTSAGVWLLANPLLGGERVHVLECRRPELDGVFTHLVEQLVEDLAAVDVVRPDLVVARRLMEWRDLLAAVGDGRMGREAQVGLFGELVVVEALVEDGVSDALQWWVASHGQPGPDFRWPGAAMEVKTTTALEGFAMRVHGLAQLDPSAAGARVWIAGVRLVVEPDGMTVPEFVEDLANRVDRGTLLARLRRRGYDHDPSRNDEWLRLVPSGLQVWEVSDATPRLHGGLVPEAWRNAITEVEYTLQAASLGTALTEEELPWR